MEVTLTRLQLAFAIFIISLSLLVGSQVWAQTVTLEHAKAKLVSKFAKFIDWPEEKSEPKFIIAVYDDIKKYIYLSDYFENKGVKGKDIEVRLVKTFKEAKDANILYIASSKRNILTSANNTLSNAHVLIITENSKDHKNTMIDLSYDKEESNIVFKVNQGNITDQQLIFPELSVFLDDKNDINEEILSMGPTATLKDKHQKEVLLLQNKIKQQEVSLNQLNTKLELSEENLKKYNLVLQKTTKRLNNAEKENAQKSQEIKTKVNELKNVEKKLQVQLAQLKENKQESSVTDNTPLLEEQNTLITELTEKLKQQKKALNNNATKLANITKKNKALTQFELLFYILSAITLIALFSSFIMWKKSKKLATTPTNDINKTLLLTREDQLIRSENFAALGYVATDITYAVNLSLLDLETQLKLNKDAKSLSILQPVIALLDKFNLIAADQDDTEIQHFDVIAYMQKMLMLYDFEFKQSDIIYNYSGEEALKIKSIPSYIAVILINIINNSLKHGFDNKGNGKITLETQKLGKNGIKIIYSDDGIGMNKATLEQVFIPFFTTRKERGYVGVGMSTTYDIVKNKLAGDIKIESKEGKGTTVIITLQ
ncbi:YfiR/HmsC family protein [Colwellia sp. UCD-KL20]|uniref:YfiR/HmsC family protein n=1 Tax=Colwellia sp. UCD-KL20 TaxID=1917165 RepID=UPI0009714D3A|nr:YfiR/HmsC family protein [Colwellia sp. UCD-KL20]